jgi:predicted acyltransferase
MILVNNPGTWDEVYPSLQHAAWNGCTPADLIFPFFLFIVGVAVTFSVAPALRLRHSRPQLVAKILRRALLLFGLGVFLNGFPLFDWSALRIPGVLQRIALCYGGAACIVLALSIRAQIVVTAALLLGYWALVGLVPVPGRHAGGFAAEVNLAAYVDNALLHGHLLWDSWDPEGLLSTLPALATTLTGVLTGHWLRSPRRPREHVIGLFAAGVFGVTAGHLLAIWCPINKNLWTSSFAVFTAGMALIVLAVCHWLIDIKQYRRWATPFLVYGTNPIVAYVLSSLTAKVMLLWKVTGASGARIDLQRYIVETCFLPLAHPINASLLYAVAYVLVWLGVTAVLYRQKVLIKI